MEILDTHNEAKVLAIKLIRENGARNNLEDFFINRHIVFCNDVIKSHPYSLTLKAYVEFGNTQNAIIES